ncbi:MAG: metal-dependent transcriptional regulator, partial [Thermotogaceae bacterium]|nr:metal-dependent transcriptional regulator [Thermotogaceae bacterium]
MSISESLEDYLKSVYQIQIEKDFARVKDVVEMLGVKTSSVISALKKLSRDGLVDYEKYSYIKLTQAGLLQASLLFEKHSSLLAFLENVLCIKREEADCLAHGIEHHINQHLLAKMEAVTKFFAGNPELLKEMQSYIGE